MCGCTKKTSTTRTINSTTRNLQNDNYSSRSLNMAKVATPELLEDLYKQYPDEFVLAEYDNGSNFRYAKSVNGGLLNYDLHYYGVFSGKRTLYVHKSDLNGENIIAVPVERELVKEEIVKLIEPETVEPIEENAESDNDTENEDAEIIDEEVTETEKPKRRRSKKSKTDEIEE